MRILIMTPLLQRRVGLTPLLPTLACIATLLSVACGDASTAGPASPPGNATPAPNSPRPSPPQMSVVAVTPVVPWWAGTAYPYQPTVQVRINGLVATDLTVRFAATSGGLVDDEFVQTDSHGVASAGQWTLGSAGINMVMAKVAYPWNTADSMLTLLAVAALAKPQTVTEYELATVNGQTPRQPSTNLENDIVGGFLRLGSNGTFEWGEDDTDLGTMIFLRGAGTYSIHDSVLVFREIAGSEAARFPSDSAIVLGDTLSTSFIKVLDIGLDPSPTLMRERYVLVRRIGVP